MLQLKIFLFFFNQTCNKLILIIYFDCNERLYFWILKPTLARNWLRTYLGHVFQLLRRKYFENNILCKKMTLLPLSGATLELRRHKEGGWGGARSKYETKIWRSWRRSVYGGTFFSFLNKYGNWRRMWPM